MSESISKLDQAKALEAQVKGMQKQKDLVLAFIKAWQEKNEGAYPPLSFKTGDKMSDIQPLMEIYLPLQSLQEFYLTYIKNMSDHIKNLEKQVNDLFR